MSFIHSFIQHFLDTERTIRTQSHTVRLHFLGKENHGQSTSKPVAQSPNLNRWYMKGNLLESLFFFFPKVGSTPNMGLELMTLRSRTACSIN